eukprot:Sdes_comp25423_c0_seq1m22772
MEEFFDDDECGQKNPLGEFFSHFMEDKTFSELIPSETNFENQSNEEENIGGNQIFSNIQIKNVCEKFESLDESFQEAENKGKFQKTNENILQEKFTDEIPEKIWKCLETSLKVSTKEKEKNYENFQNENLKLKFPEWIENIEDELKNSDFFHSPLKLIPGKILHN